MLINKTVKVKWNNKTKKYYEDLGYKFTKNGDEFEVKVEDLFKNSHYKVECICDNCKKDLNWCYVDYNKQVKEDGKTYCNKCSGKLFGKKKEIITRIKNYGSMAQYILDNFPDKDLYDIWDKEKNGNLDPWSITQKSSRIKIWIICQEKDYHGSYEILCSEFTGGIGCPYCSLKGNRIHPKDSLGQYIIDNYGEEFLSVWSDKNKKSPFEYAPKSKKEVWWKCPNGEHEEYLRTIDSSNYCEFRCPKCVEEMNNSIIENKAKSYLYELGYNVLSEHKCTIRPINPKTKMPLPFDNEIILENGKHLIIEVHGEQHYKIDRLHNKTKEDLHYQQVKDRYKRIKCKQAGYEYLEIPYTAFDKKETYKELIDNKINEILNISKAS